MPPTDDHYQRYADALGEPVTDDLIAFVDDLDAPFLAVPLPDSLARFTPTAPITTQQETTPMSLPPNDAIPSSAKPSTPPPRSRVSLGLVAALILIVVLVGGLLARAALSSRSTPTPPAIAPTMNQPTPTATALPPRKVVTCLGISLQEAAPDVTSCTTVPLVTSVPNNSLVNFTYCYTTDIPLPSAVLLRITGPDGHHYDAAGPLQGSKPRCDQSGSHVDQTGVYTAQIYWNPNPASMPSATLDPTWQLQLTQHFTAK